MLKNFIRASAFALLLVAPAAAASSDRVVQPDGAEVAKDCCKICRKGKACGDTCISRDKVCRTPPGCACDG